MTATTDRRTELTDAAIATLAELGMRGLTHRAVDRAAGVAEGSTSYYFRTREALLEATVARLSDLTLSRMGALPRPATTLDGLADMITTWVSAMVTEGRAALLARYELSLEATRRPALREHLRRTGAVFRELATEQLVAIGTPDAERRGRDLVAYLDGLMFDEVAGAGGGTLDRDRLAAAVRDLLGVLTG
ncbi:TetR family transcriptional regulator [Herbihabitans rhizosphaerae]|uniref:TetR family transcriptional regulator n=1 Tax=Herbihabitans rhizosphaerae TaxID=1872711 RepID=A0A4Q7KGR0_9PSEU|nr:TetR/AcrR family transcriptional regulator [Herbihabitans rhizosphaerae]RZS34048.1 TetR family transcriptional regulator [Herbihabitans rhizosphaerae]